MTTEFTIFKGSPSKKIVQAKVMLELKPTEAVVRHTHSGVCSTDLELADRPNSLGHEGIGIVEKLGSSAHLLSDVKVGDRVGLGWMQKYCNKCRSCRSGNDWLCENGKELWAEHNSIGSFGSGGTWDVTALRKIPDEIESKYAAPLMCAGATVWGAMQRGKIMSHHRVGVLGIGGLGHLAIQFLCKSGCEVVVVSSTETKKNEALSFGAAEFHTVDSIRNLKDKKFKGLDFLIVCTGAQPDYSLYMPIMAMHGTILPLTVDFESTPIPLAPTIFGGVNIVGVKVCSRNEYDDMFNFCVRHGIKPTIQEYPMTEEGINEAVSDMQHGKTHYRAVLVA